MITRYRLRLSHLLWLLPAAILFSLCTEAATVIRANQIKLSDIFAFTGANTHAAAETFSVQPVITPTTNQLLFGTAPNQTTINFPAPSGNVTITGPNTTDTLVGRSTTDTLANKTLTSPVITGGLAVAQGGTAQTVASTFSASAGAYPVMFSCATTSTCSNTALGTTARIFFGSAPLVSGTPSAVTITGISPAFTSSSTYVCTVTDATTATNNLLKVVNVSGSSFTITGPNTLTDTINFQCTGN